MNDRAPLVMPEQDPLGALPRLNEALTVLVTALVMLPVAERRPALARFVQQAEAMLSGFEQPSAKGHAP